MSGKANRPILLGKEFFPSENSGLRDLTYHRNRLIDSRNANLQYLNRERYNWMKGYITSDMSGIEVGAGIGGSALILEGYRYIMTDCYQHAWIEKVVDAMELPFDDQSLDYIIASNVIHHLPYPMRFFSEAKRTLKPGGLIMINDVTCSFFMRLFLKFFKHEGYSYDRDPFSLVQPCNNPGDPWSGNNAVADLVFSDKEAFQERTGLKIIHDQPCEFLVFLLSGGVSSQFFTIQMPKAVLRIFTGIDKFLSIFKGVFPLARHTVIKT